MFNGRWSDPRRSEELDEISQARESLMRADLAARALKRIYEVLSVSVPLGLDGL